MVLKTKWTNLNRFQCFGSFLQRPKKVSEAVVARSFAILPRSAISGMARQRFLQKIAYHWSTQRLFCICAMLLTYKNSALVVGKVKNRKFNQEFCSNNWFFMDQKGRCGSTLSISFLNFLLHHKSFFFCCWVFSISFDLRFGLPLLQNKNSIVTIPFWVFALVFFL